MRELCASYLGHLLLLKGLRALHGRLLRGKARRLLFVDGLGALHNGLLGYRLGDLLLLNGLGALHGRLLRDRLGGEGLLLGGRRDGGGLCLRVCLRLRLREGESLRLGGGLRLNLRQLSSLRRLRGGERLLRVQRAAQHRAEAEADRRVRDGYGGGHERGGAGIDRGHGSRRGEAVQKHIAGLVLVLVLQSLLMRLRDLVLDLVTKFGILQ